MYGITRARRINKFSIIRCWRAAVSVRSTSVGCQYDRWPNYTAAKPARTTCWRLLRILSSNCISRHDTIRDHSFVSKERIKFITRENLWKLCELNLCHVRQESTNPCANISTNRRLSSRVVDVCRNGIELQQEITTVLSSWWLSLESTMTDF